MITKRLKWRQSRKSRITVTLVCTSHFFMRCYTVGKRSIFMNDLSFDESICSSPAPYCVVLLFWERDKLSHRSYYTTKCFQYCIMWDNYLSYHQSQTMMDGSENSPSLSLLLTILLFWASFIFGHGINYFLLESEYNSRCTRIEKWRAIKLIHAVWLFSKK